MPDDSNQRREDVNASREGHNAARELSNVSRETANTVREDTNHIEETAHTEAKDQTLGILRFIRWVLLVLVVLLTATIFRATVVQDSAERAERASIRAEEASLASRDAARDAARDLANALDRAESANEPDLQNQAIIDALQAVARIEIFLCGGPCDE